MLLFMVSACSSSRRVSVSEHSEATHAVSDSIMVGNARHDRLAVVTRLTLSADSACILIRDTAGLSIAIMSPRVVAAREYSLCHASDDTLTVMMSREITDTTMSVHEESASLEMSASSVAVGVSELLFCALVTALCLVIIYLKKGQR